MAREYVDQGLVAKAEVEAWIKATEDNYVETPDETDYRVETIMKKKNKGSRPSEQGKTRDSKGKFNPGRSGNLNGSALQWSRVCVIKNEF